MQLPPTAYGEAWAEDYDLTNELPQAVTDAAVDLVFRYAEGGKVIEVGTGTGRLSLPLAARGLEVEGTDASPEMLAKLREKDPAGSVRTRVAVFADLPPDGSAAVVLAAFNCINALATWEGQLEFVRAAAAALRPGGALIIEAGFIDPRNFVPSRLMKMTDEFVVARFGSYDHLSQRVEQAALVWIGDKLDMRRDIGRAIHPTELTLMGMLAGLELEGHYSDWRGTPVTPRPAPSAIVSVLRRPI